jgi:HlyD family secretion protein
VPIQAVTVRSLRELAKKGAGAGPGALPSAPTAGALAKPGQPAKKDPMRKIVFVVEDGVAMVRPVETGLASEDEIEIVTGIKDGERLVEGPYRALSRDLKDGKPVRQATTEGDGKREDKP